LINKILRRFPAFPPPLEEVGIQKNAPYTRGHFLTCSALTAFVSGCFGGFIDAAAQIHRDAIGQWIDKLAKRAFGTFAGTLTTDRRLGSFLAFAFFEINKKQLHIGIADLAMAGHFFKHLAIPYPE